MIRLIGPGGAGKSTIGALLAERLDLAFVDLDRHLADRVGDIGDYINAHGYGTYARENVETYWSLVRADKPPDVVALSSGFMTYSPAFTRNIRLCVTESSGARPRLCSCLRSSAIFASPRRSDGKSVVRSVVPLAERKRSSEHDSRSIRLCLCRRLRRCVTSSRLSTRSLLRYTGKGC